MYQANGIPLYFGLLSLAASAFVHLMIMSGIIALAAPAVFGARAVTQPFLYAGKLALFTAASLGVAGAAGLLVKNQAKLTMYCQIVFLPSILLSGIMFPADLLPGALEMFGRLFPAAWGYRLLAGAETGGTAALVLTGICLLAAALCVFLLKRIGTE